MFADSVLSEPEFDMEPARRAAVVPIMLLVLAACGPDGPPAADSPLTREEEAVEETVVAFFDAIHGYDYDALRRLVTSDFELVEDTVVMDISAFVDMIRPYEDRGGAITYELSEFNTEVRGQVAWTRYRNQGVLRMGEEEMQLEWLESAVLLEDEDEWKIDRLQSAPVGRARTD